MEQLEKASTTLRSIIAPIILTVIAVTATGQDNRPKSSLTIDKIFDQRAFAVESYSVEWMPNGNRYSVQERPPANNDRGTGNGSATGEANSDQTNPGDIVLVDPVTGDRTTLLPGRLLKRPNLDKPLDVESFQVSPDGKRLLLFTNAQRVWRLKTRGDYWVVDLEKQSFKKLGGNDAKPATLMFAKFSPDSQSVAYVRDRNIYVESVDQDSLRKLTETPNEFIINGTSDWVYEEELYLRDGFVWSDDGRHIVYWRFDTSGVGVFTMIDNTSKKYPELIQFPYPKVGTTNSAVSIEICDVATGRSKNVALPGDPREYYPAKIDWIPKSNEFLLQRLNRLQNENTIFKVDADSANAEPLTVDRGSAWVEVCYQIQFWSDGTAFSFLSERDGWRHLYRADLASGEMTCLTPGDFDIVTLHHIDLESQTLLYSASPSTPTKQQLFLQKFGESPQQLTPKDQTGWHDYDVCADGTVAVHKYSQFGRPPKFETVRLPSHEVLEVNQTNSTTTERLGELSEQKHDFYRVELETESGEPFEADAMVMYPANFDASKKYPCIVYVYSEPWGMTVKDQWGGDRFLWHRLLCENGYAVLSLDNRGTAAARGAKWRKAIYKSIGRVNAGDQAAALRASLNKFDWLDRDRVGIWGWSGGGSATLNAMFKYPDLYHTGVSVAPVPDQHYYDTIYQERYMQTPDLNEAGLTQGSPINFSQKLKGELLLIHGTGDDNCHYQTMELLINKLIAENKSFQMMAYPNRSHAIREFENTSRHLYQLMTDFFMRHLPAGPVEK